ncbi:transcriptional regulator, TetR family [Enhydrobacter aerosaccus]|uniref:Transcriptional regulator, TetR family n=1 Tax=Enhydrobacter aerosaccus TaxID=225324 RepID=A0A1T4TK31_9HYPH|nr:TetR/AcrR family transcriptional regulator [Enhydrobacter aerosaccus]SKA40631.1 transcriptional regulator, TetR family [Enhydrobacter aerosaccus]
MASRQRRTPQAAKLAILEAAERRLHDEGPDGVRIQRIATDLGLTDAAIHYHFGTREALMDALLRRIGRRLVDDIEATIESWAPDRIDVAALGRLFQRAYADERAARLAHWLSLAGWRPKGSGMFRPLVERVHRARVQAARKAGRATPRLADTQHAIALLSAAHMHAAMSGDAVLASVATERPGPDPRSFLDFAVKLIAHHLAQS